MLEDEIFLKIQSGKKFDCSVIFVMIFSKNLFFFVQLVIIGYGLTFCLNLFFFARIRCPVL